MKLGTPHQHSTEYKCCTCGKIHYCSTHAAFEPERETITDLVKKQQGQTKPVTGDLSVCSGCGTISIFKEDGDIRALTPEELVEFYQKDDHAYLECQKLSKFFKNPITKAIQKKQDDERRRRTAEQTAQPGDQKSAGDN